MHIEPMSSSGGAQPPSAQPTPRSFWHSLRVPAPLTWAAVVILLTTQFHWAWLWARSGTPLLCFIILATKNTDGQPLPVLQVWALLATINLSYAIAVTSWPLYIAFMATSWPVTMLACLFHFPFAADRARRGLRALLSQLHFIHDKIAFFDLPALEIDTEVAGLMVIRGLTVSLSSLTIEAHGVEVGIKLTDDMELAIQTEKVRISLFRRIEISDVFANLKGGIHEMTFGELEENTEDAEGNALMNSNTTLIRAATAKVDEMDSDKVKMTEHMTHGKEMKDSSPQKVVESLTQLSPSDQHAIEKYNEIMDAIDETNAINLVRKRLEKSKKNTDELTTKDRRSAICSLLHDGPSIAHPPSRSIRVTTLQTLSSPSTKRFMHRLPLLLRLLLNPLSYFHPVKISSITAAASGAWIKHMLSNNVFKEYADNDSDIRSIRDRIMSWLSDANFTVQLDNITGLAQVPIITDFNILCNLGIKSIVVYRTLPKSIDLIQVAQLGGADFTCSVPSFLLPHHEHLLPPVPSTTHKKEIANEIETADLAPERLQAQRDLTQAEKDETNVNMSVHVRLPACFDQTLLNFAAALVKATKLIEMDRTAHRTNSDLLDTAEEDEEEEQNHDHDHGHDDTDADSIISTSESTYAKSPTKSSFTHRRASSIKELARSLNEKTKSLNEKTKLSIKKVAVNGVVNDRWIAKMVGKVTKMLEGAHGDLGYSGDIPVLLGPYRDAGRGEGSKLLP